MCFCKPCINIFSQYWKWSASASECLCVFRWKESKHFLESTKILYSVNAWILIGWNIPCDCYFTFTEKRASSLIVISVKQDGVHYKILTDAHLDQLINWSLRFYENGSLGHAYNSKIACMYYFHAFRDWRIMQCFLLSVCPSVFNSICL